MRMVAGGYRQDGDRPVTDTGGVQLSRRTAGFLIAAGLWPLLVWPNFVRVVVTDERAFDDGPTAYLVVHVALAAVSMLLGAGLLVLGVRGLRRRGRDPLSRAGRSARA